MPSPSPLPFQSNSSDDSLKLDRSQSRWGQFGLSMLAVLLLLCLELLLHGNMSGVGWNEVDVLPIAKQFAQPSWIPTDWYLNQPPTYRVLFQSIFGWMIASWGFLATSIVGRFFCYVLFAVGVVLLGRKIGLNLPFLLLAVSLFLYGGCDELFNNCGFRQGAIAGEWWIGALEAKAIAYSVLPLALWLMLEGQYRWMALLLGIATSFHVLAGGWAFLAAVGWILLNRKLDWSQPKYWASVFLIYLAGSVFAIPPVLNQLLTPTPVGAFPPSYFYVFVRLPHHLNPLAWAPELWIRPVVLLILFAVSLVLIRRGLKLDRPAAEVTENSASLALAQWALIALIPFGLGLLIALFDTQGQFLQYYPFRLGDVALPFATALLLSKVLQQSFMGQRYKIALYLCVLLLSVVFVTRIVNFTNQVASLGQFPGEVQEVDAKQRDFYSWIRDNTPKESIIVSPPVEMINFTWLAERGTIAKFKFMPQTKAGILAWYERMIDLGGGNPDWAQVQRNEDGRRQMQKQLTENYDRLKTDQVIVLMNKYEANYFATIRKHRLNLPIAYRNSDYVLYARPS